MKQLIVAVMALVLVACASMMGDRTVTVSSAQIQEKLNEKLSVPIALLKIFDVSLSNAAVTFDESTGRMTTTMDTTLTSRLFKQSLAGNLGISGKLRFDPEKSAVILDAPKVENLDLDGGDAKFNDLLSALAETVGGDMLNGLTLYKVKPEDLNVSGVQYTPKNMAVTSNGLQITLSPN